MGFLQVLFLAGAATFAVPVAIHLFFRSRTRSLVFSSLRFIQVSLLRQQSRLRLRDLIILLLRCAACILVALAFARPFRYSQLLSGSGEQPREDLVIVLDDSPSMAAQDRSQPRWEPALAKARAACQSRRPGDRVGLILASDPARAEVELAANFGAILAALNRDRPSDRRGDLAAAARSAAMLLRDATAPKRRVLVITDAQANQFDRGAWGELAQLLAAQSQGILVDLQYPEQSRPERLPNLCVADVRAKSDVWIESQPLRFAVRIENHGPGEIPGLAVRMSSEGRTLAQRTVGLGPFDATEIELGAVFAHAGAVAGSVEIEAHDALPLDDRRFFALHLRDSLRVLVVEDALRESESYLDQTYYLRMALDPQPRGKDAGTWKKARNYVQVKALPAPALTPAALKGADLVLLAGISELPAPALVALEEAVRAGRNLVLFLGRSDGELSQGFYNGSFYKDGKGLLPARLAGRYEGNLLEKKYNGLDAFQAEHPIFKIFAGSERELRMPRFLRNYRLEPDDLKRSAEGQPAAEVLASFNDGSPLLVERRYGKGKVLVFTFCPRPERDTDLPKRKVFVPLLHQVVRYLAGTESQWGGDLLIGQQLDFLSAGIPPEQSFKLLRPAPQKEALNCTPSDIVTADSRGIYEANFKSGNLAQNRLWAANLDPLEAQLNSEDLASLKPLFASNPEGPQRQAESDLSALEGQSLDELKAQAQDWRYFLLAAFCCLLLEVVLRDFWGD